MARPLTEATRGDSHEALAIASAEARAGQLVARIFQAVLAAGMLLVVVGSIVELVTTGRLPDTTVPAGQLPQLVVRGDGDAVLTLGILVFLLGPVCGVLALAYAYVRAGDRRTGLLALLVLVIVGSAPLVRLLRGS